MLINLVTVLYLQKITGLHDLLKITVRTLFYLIEFYSRRIGLKVQRHMGTLKMRNMNMRDMKM